MPQTINTNIASLVAQRNLNTSQSALDIALQRLSSGLRINSARDDAAGLAISERFTSQIRGMDQARRNASDGVSLAQTAEGSLSSAGDILQRVRELSVQSANASNSASDRQALQAEVTELVAELDRIAQTAEFNGRKILDGTFGSAVYQVGPNANQTITATTGNFRTTAYGNYRVTGQASSGAAASRFGGETLTVNGSAGSSAITVAANSSAKTVSEQVNAVTGSTNVKASAKTELDITFGTAGAYTINVTSDNSSAIALAFTISATTGTDGLAAAVEAFNNQSSKTGVTAKVNTGGTGVTLTNSSGNNITLADTTTANAGNVVVGGATLTADTTANTAVISGQVILDSDKTFGATGDAAETLTGVNVTATLMKVSELDVTTVDNATKALAIVDSALSAVSSQRAKFGALQSRFETTISNLQVASDNLSAARSRIRDADFAAETANLTRGQILQQAGAAILAQANALPQNVLTLLR